MIIVETAEQVGALTRVNGGATVWVATGPGAVAELDRRGIAYRTIDEFTTPAAVNAAYLASRRMTEKLCESGDGYVWKSFPELSKRRIKPFLFSFYQLALKFDYIYRRTTEIDGIFQALKPARVLCADRTDYEIATEVVKTKRNNFECELVKIDGSWAAPQNGKSPIGTRFKLALKRLIQTRPILNTLQKNIAFSGYQGLFGLATRLVRKGKTVVIVGDAYEWDFCRLLFAEKGYRLIDVAPHQFKSRNINLAKADVAVDDLLRGAGLTLSFSLEVIDLTPVIAPVIKELMPVTIDRCLRAGDVAARFFETKKIDAVLISVLPSSGAHCYTTAARENNIPVFSCQHGSGGFYEHLTQPYTDILPADYYLVSGAGVASTYYKYGERFNCHIVPTGSPSLDYLGVQAMEIVKHRTRVLYVTSHYIQHDNYYALSDLFYSDIAYYRAQKLLMAGLAKLNDVDIVCKLHPGFAYDEPPWAAEQHQQNIRLIKREKIFTELAKAADVILIDRASTVLMQAIALNKPVYLLQDVEAFFAGDSLSLLRKRVVCSKNAEELIDLLNTYLITGEYQADINNREFLKEYGTYKDDGKSAERMVAEVIKAVNYNENSKRLGTQSHL